MVTIAEAITLASMSGLGVQLLSLVELRNVPKNRRPDFKSLIYWLPYLIHPLLGAFLAYVYVRDDGVALNSVLCIHIGASAPLLFRTLANTIPKKLVP